jgi:hypothetical protein
MALRKDVKGFGMPWEDQYGYVPDIRGRVRNRYLFRF